ncbi:MAG: pseudouridine synthase, RluA family, partial [Spirochaeta sp.]|nr:pseudouridine synthase, RluA family [Spirochaeta sp.]
MGVKKGRVDLVVEPMEHPVRLDVYVAGHTDLISRSTLSETETVIQLNGKASKKSKLVREGDHITVLYSENFFAG